MLARQLRRRRRGTTTVQWIMIAAVVTIIVVTSIQFMGQETNERLEQTSGGVGNPSELVQIID